MKYLAIENALQSSKLCVRRLTQSEIELMGLDVRFDWLSIQKRIKQGDQIIPDFMEGMNART